jgi:C4-type Zn-finger protein
MDGRVECPACHTIIDSGDYDSYELLDVDSSYCGDIFSITIRCSRCGAILEVL